MNITRKILIVEDEPDIVRLVEYNLRKAGFSTESANTGVDALKKLRTKHYDLIILDLMLPEMDGFELCRIVKNDKAISSIPIIMLTARGEEVDRILGLELGADDYITKPFSPRELVARVKAILRRVEKGYSSSEPEEVIRKGDLEIDVSKFKVYKRGLPLEVSVKEFRLLLHLATHPGRVFTRQRLLDEVWGDEVYIEPRTVDVHIRRLREKIEDNPSSPRYILTKRGVGYYFTEEE